MSEDRFLLGVVLYSGVLAAICAMIVWAIVFRMHQRRNAIKQGGRK
jgi:hypothetical protein